MSIRRTLVLCLAFLALTPAFVGATTGEYVAVTCLVCDNKFEGWEIHSSNTYGVDTDFCEHGGGDAPLMLLTWTCPACGYSGDSDDFDREQVPAAFLAALRKQNPLKPPVPLDRKLRRSTDIPAWARKDLHLQCATLRGDVLVRTRFWIAMSAAWTQRFDVPVPAALHEAFKALPPAHHDRPGDEHALDDRGQGRRQALARERDAADPALTLSPDQRRLGLLEAALRLKERGEDPDARRVMAALRAAFPSLPEAEAALARDLEERLARERHYLGLALPLLEQVITSRAWPEKGAGEYDHRYLLGELYRKLGRDDDARRTLQAVQQDPKAPPAVLEWVERSLARMPAPR